ncbi:MAG TPA: SMI1/KNR4 family protein [Peptococcaceae bacterium]|nr:SMI1/KNR4 family protein [Peptococcaceae bacterium]
MNIYKNPPPSKTDIEEFISNATFKLPAGYIEFLEESNGADICFDNTYLLLWPLTDLFFLNQEYDVEVFAPNFFLIGSDGGDTAYAISKKTGYIYEMPFIGMSSKEAILVSNDFNGLLRKLATSPNKDN